jgi:hypothetical protein
MRDQHRVDVAQTVACRHRLDATEGSDAGASDGVRDDPDTVKVDDDG